MTKTGDPEAITLADLPMSVPRSVYGAEAPQMEGDDPIYDKTQLSLHEGFKFMRIHRDYLAHAIRFEHIVSQIKPDRHQAIILDVGCGDVPLMRALDSGMNRPRLYVGVDVRRSVIENRRRHFRERASTFPMELLSLDFTEAPPELLQMPWTHVVCFEVLEHMPKARGQRLLSNLRSAIDPHGRLFLSTPCFDGSHKAQRHHYEWKWAELGSELEAQGFTVKHKWGTFANVKDLERNLTPEEAVVYQGLKGYFGTVARSLIFAPLHPELARNCLWELTT